MDGWMDVKNTYKLPYLDNDLSTRGARVAGTIRVRHPFLESYMLESRSS